MRLAADGDLIQEVQVKKIISPPSIEISGPIDFIFTALAYALVQSS